jgi:hypothetical protein
MKKIFVIANKEWNIDCEKKFKLKRLENDHPLKIPLIHSLFNSAAIQ